MAKGLKTRQKLVYRADGLRPRNPLAARKPAAGTRGPAAGNLRRLARRRLRGAP
jgi:hypothetical protein